VFLNLYRNTIEILANFVPGSLGLPDVDQSHLRWENTGDEMNNIGTSVAVTFRLRERLRLGFNYMFRYSWNADTGDRMEREPAHLLNLYGYWLSRYGLRLGAALHAFSSFDDFTRPSGSIFEESVWRRNPAGLTVSGFASWRFTAPWGSAEVGLRAQNLFHAGFRDRVSVIRFDGVELGGELMGRQVFVYMRGNL
jgi:hypothetical protein